MIRFAVIYRVKDGLALSASTDIDAGLELRDSKRYAKVITRKIKQFGTRSWMAVGQFRIFCTSESECCFLLISEANLQPILAYSFLEELKKDFFNKFTPNAVQKAIRPYSFIEFDGVIQKHKQRYNNTRTLCTKVSLGSISEELQNNPPLEITEQDLFGTVIAASVLRKTQLPSSSKYTTKSNPLSMIGKLSLVMVLLCGILNFMRLMLFITQYHYDHEDEDHWLSICICYSLSSIINIGQCYLLIYEVQKRTIKNILCILANMVLLYYLRSLRDHTQTMFHLLSNFLIFYSISMKTATVKPSNYNI
ncbi:vesicle-trafficking protein SEC22a isoform X1 [Hydra vulgaris]|uniref:Vesicle-trafficking protein SEC22a n=1 Tax=Hydra vulgaris TaxID=6087 RepID=T2M7E8_HYDVU|nr:vesicle-trafficking protein SEC22a [Hydra vulgaris]